MSTLLWVDIANNSSRTVVLKEAIVHLQRNCKRKIDLKIGEIIVLDNLWQCFAKLLSLSWDTEM